MRGTVIFDNVLGGGGGGGTLFSFGNGHFKAQGCTPGIWSSWESGTFMTKIMMVAKRFGQIYERD